MQYRREIDGLRALAVLPVILFHAGFQAFSGGFVGVDVFFVISGYLITSIIIAEKKSGTFTLINFYERRARRILPALFVVMFFCLPFAWFWLLPQDMKIFSQSLMAVSAFVSNIFFWRTSGYFETAAELKPLLHTWSLAVEEQYYLLFPLFLTATWKFGKRWVLSVFAVVFIISITMAQWSSSSEPITAFFLLHTRGWELLIGVFIAFYIADKGRVFQARYFNEIGGVVGLALLVYSIWSFDNRTPFPSLYTLVPTMGAALIIACASDSTWIGKLLGHKVFVGIGLISYSAYLWHQPLLAFTRHKLLDELSANQALSVVFLTFCFAFLSWKYVENPFRNKCGFSRRKVFTLGLCGALFFSCFGLFGAISNGFESRVSYTDAYKIYDGDIGHLDFHKYVAEKYVQCTPDHIAKEALTWNGFVRCKQSKSVDAVDIALVGDSHAEHLFIGLADRLVDKNVAFYIKNSYPILSNPEFANIFNHIVQSSSIRVVFLAAHWVLRMDEIPDNAALDKELVKTVSALVAAGKTVYLLDDIPKFPFPPEHCKFLVDGFTKTTCEIPKSQILKYEQKYQIVLKNVAMQVPAVRLIEIRDLFCDELTCSMVKSGLLMYRDQNHLNIFGSKYVGSEIVSRFPELSK